MLHTKKIIPILLGSQDTKFIPEMKLGSYGSNRRHKRMSQRGINALLVDLVYEYGLEDSDKLVLDEKYRHLLEEMAKVSGNWSELDLGVELSWWKLTTLRSLLRFGQLLSC